MSQCRERCLLHRRFFILESRRSQILIVANEALLNAFSVCSLCAPVISKPHCSLKPEEAVLLQADSDRDFERWAKTLAVELLRQTPLDALRYLDVLAITATAHDAGHVDHEYATDKEVVILNSS